MSRREVTDSLNNIFVEVFGDPGIEIFDTMTASDIEGWDSLQQINIIINCEEYWNIKFELDEIGKMENVGKMIDYIMEKIND